MILSALLTSVGINLGLCFLFFTLYSILSQQPGNLTVYAPRLVAERKLKQKTDFNLERLLSSAGWVKRAWKPSEAELLENSGLDAVVFMRIFTFSLKVFAIAAIIGIFVLLPINFMGNQLVIDFSDLPNKSLDSFSISNVNNGSKRLWIHFCAAYVFTAVVCYLLYYEYKLISLKRIACFYASQPQAHQFTVLVRAIPVPAGSSLSESIDQFFREYHPSTYLSHTVVRRTSKLQQLAGDAEKLYKKVAQIKSEEHTSQRSRYNGFLGFFSNRDRHLRTLEKRLEAMEDNMRLEHSSISEKEVPAAFVSFKSRYSAAVALHIQQGVNPTEWVTEEAPEPDDVYWPFFSTSYLKSWICKLVVFVASTIVTVLFLVPVVIVQGLTHLEQLETYFPFLKSILTIAFVSQVITGYLPSLILQLFLFFIPPIMKMLSSIQGYISMSEIQKSACNKVLWFTIWNIFFANVLSGSALSQVNVFLEPKQVPTLLAQGVPAQLLNAYAPKDDTGGKYWPIVHNSTIFSLALMHIIAIGMFGLKELPMASSLTIPLPILTLLFNEYCRKRFLPLFKAYAAECLIKKDREEQSDPRMTQFREELMAAYQDPALKPSQYSRDSDQHTTPLLHSSEI